jgi:hypothetical protein
MEHSPEIVCAADLVKSSQHMSNEGLMLLTLDAERSLGLMRISRAMLDVSILALDEYLKAGRGHAGFYGHTLPKMSLCGKLRVEG